VDGAAKMIATAVSDFDKGFMLGVAYDAISPHRLLKLRATSSSSYGVK